MQKVVFTRKAKKSDELRAGTWSEQEPCRVVVERVIELPRAHFRAFADNLLADYDFLQENRDGMYVDSNQVWHCLLVKAKGGRDGLLVNAEGYASARYTAYCPDVKAFLPHQNQEDATKDGGGGDMKPHTPPQDRLFLVTYEYTESGEVQRCGFLCKARTIREAAEVFWNQHPGNEFALQRITDGTLEAYWVKESGQFVTVPQREEESSTARAVLCDALHGLRAEMKAGTLPRQHERRGGLPTSRAARAAEREHE